MCKWNAWNKNSPALNDAQMEKELNHKDTKCTKEDVMKDEG